MKFRRRPSPLLLLLLPSIAAAIVAGAPDNALDTLSQNARRDVALAGPDPTPDLSGAIQGKTSNYGVGTKDAPVDGKDGKPHAGPFVDPQGDRKKTKEATTAAEGELVTGKKITLEGAPKDTTVHDGVKIPESNDGVMNDPNRPVPKKGTTGLEGGISSSTSESLGDKLEKGAAKPVQAATPLNAKEGLKSLKGTDSESDNTGADKLAGLEKPADLPDKPHDIPHPLPDSANKDHLDISKGAGSKLSDKTLKPEDESAFIQPLHSYILSLTMILCSEVGDKTFLIAALMAMKHDRLLVFSAAFSALIAMTVLSAVLGHAVPTLIPKRVTNYLAAALFLVFGTKMLREGMAMSPDEGVSEEMQEVEMELQEKEHKARKHDRRRSSASPYNLEMGLGRTGSRKSRSGSRLPSPPRSPSMSPDRSPSPQRSSLKGAMSGVNNLFSFLLSPAWVQTFVMTFLGEWGDRSQIATIAMAAGSDYWWVTGGAISGHAVCTGVAVLGGRAIAGRVSMRVVTLSGAVAFLFFGIVYFIEALSNAEA